MVYPVLAQAWIYNEIWLRCVGQGLNPKVRRRAIEKRFSHRFGQKQTVLFDIASDFSPFDIADDDTLANKH